MVYDYSIWNAVVSLSIKSVAFISKDTMFAMKMSTQITNIIQLYNQSVTKMNLDYSIPNAVYFSLGGRYKVFPTKISLRT